MKLRFIDKLFVKNVVIDIYSIPSEFYSRYFSTTLNRQRDIYILKKIAYCLFINKEYTNIIRLILRDRHTSK